MSESAIAAIAVAAALLLIFGYLFIGMGMKFLWGWWPALAALVGAGLTLWHSGIELLWAAGMMLMGAVLLPWLWQRTRFYMRVDNALDKFFLLDD